MHSIIKIKHLFSLRILSLKRLASSTKWSYQHNVSEYPLLGLTSGQQFEKTVNLCKDKPAIISPYENRILTYGNLSDNVDRLAAALIFDLGLQKGDFVGIWSPNCTQWLVASLACAKVGLVSVQLNYSYKAKELLYCANKAKIKALICGKHYPKQNYYELLKSIDDDIFQESCKVNSKVLPFLKSVISMQPNLLGTYYFDDLITKADENNVKTVRRSINDVQIDDYLNVQFTSGSTGNPKAAILTHHNVLNNSLLIGRKLDFHKMSTKICVQVPFFHTFGSTAAVFSCVNFGVTLVLPYDFYNPEKSLFCIKEHNCNVIYGTPTMYVDLISQQNIHKFDINPDLALLGGSLSTKQLLNKVYDVLNCKSVVNIYGLTETTAVVYQCKINGPKKVTLESAGYLQDHTEVKVVDENNKIVPLGTAGELLVRGYCNMIEYFEDPEKTAQTIGKDRWLRTGDKFIMNEDGTGCVVGRIKDIIIRGGENVHPKEIEDFICTNPKVEDCQVVGLPHERLGEEVCACVRLKDGQHLTLAEVKEFCKDNMAHYKVPSKLDFFVEFPKTTSGKVQKFKIIEELKKRYKIKSE